MESKRQLPILPTLMIPHSLTTDEICPSTYNGYDCLNRQMPQSTHTSHRGFSSVEWIQPVQYLIPPSGVSTPEIHSTHLDRARLQHTLHRVARFGGIFQRTH